MWHYTGACIAQAMCSESNELHEVMWRPAPADAVARAAAAFAPVYLTKAQRDTAGLDAKGRVQSGTDLRALANGSGSNGTTTMATAVHPVDKVLASANAKGGYVPPHLRGFYYLVQCFEIILLSRRAHLADGQNAADDQEAAGAQSRKVAR